MSTENPNTRGRRQASKHDSSVGREEVAKQVADNDNKKLRRELQILEERLKRLRGFGTSARQRRLDRLDVVLTRRNQLKDGVNEYEARRRARDEIHELLARYQHLEKEAQDLAPSWISPDPDDLHDHIWTHAVLQVPQVAFIKRELERRCASGRGRKPKGFRQLPVAVFNQMALGGEAPDVTATLKSFQGNPFRMWALHHPEAGPDYKALLKSIKATLARTPVSLAQHTMVDLARELTEETDQEGRLLHPGAMEILAADATLVQAPIDQNKPLNEKDAQRTRGRKRPKVGYVIYRSDRSFEQTEKREDPDRGYEPRQAGDAAHTDRRRPPKKVCHGYKLVSLACLKLNRPVIAGLFPANVDEREATLELLDLLFELWPDAPVKVLAGDSLFDSARFCDDLFFRYGIDPVFARGRAPSKKFDYVEGNAERPGFDGVPTCEHGLMEFHKREKWYDADRRRDLGIPRGMPAPDRDARIRWKCPAGVCKEQASWVRKNPRLYTLYPRIDLKTLERLEADQRAAIDAQRKAAGKKPSRETPRQSVRNRRAARRIVIEARRNLIESVFASLKADQLAGVARLKAYWAEDAQMEWLLLMHLVGLLARVHAWTDDGYARALEEAQSLDLTRIPTPDNPGCGPTAAELRDAIATRVTEIPRPPLTWHRPPAHTEADDWDAGGDSAVA